MSEAEQELIYEGDVAEQLGLDRKALAKVRAGVQLVQGEDWENGPHRRFMYRASGLKKITAAVAAQQGDTEPEPGVEGMGANGLVGSAEGALVGSKASLTGPVLPVLPKIKVPRVFLARVVNVPRFSKLLECVRVGAETREILRVKVQKNENFKEGMQVPIREALGQGPGVFYYDGVLPKRKGVLPAYGKTNRRKTK